MLAENYCYLKAWNMVMKMVKAGLFGEIYYAEGDYLMNFHQRLGFQNLLFQFFGQFSLLFDGS